MLNLLLASDNNARLYIGPVTDAQDYFMMEKLGVDVIIGVAQGVKIQPPDKFTYLYFPLLDDYRFPGPDLEESQIRLTKHAVAAAVRFLKAGRVVLVHCAAGISRSSIICIAALKELNGLTWDEAENLVRAKHPPAAMLNRPLFVLTRKWLGGK